MSLHPLALGMPPSANPMAQAPHPTHSWASDLPATEGSRGHPLRKQLGQCPPVPGHATACSTERAGVWTSRLAARPAPPHPPVQRDRELTCAKNHLTAGGFVKSKICSKNEHQRVSDPTRPHRSHLEPTAPSQGLNPATDTNVLGPPPAPAAQTHPLFPHFLPHWPSLSRVSPSASALCTRLFFISFIRLGATGGQAPLLCHLPLQPQCLSWLGN